MMMREEYGFQIAEPVVVERGVLSGVDQQSVVAAGIIDEQRRVARRAVHQSEFAKLRAGQPLRYAHSACW